MADTAVAFASPLSSTPVRTAEPLHGAGPEAKDVIDHEHRIDNVGLTIAVEVTLSVIHGDGTAGEDVVDEIDGIGDVDLSRCVGVATNGGLCDRSMKKDGNEQQGEERS